MWTDLKNLTLAVLLIYGVAYGLGFIFALIKNRNVIKQELVKANNKVIMLDKVLVLGFLILVAIASSGCSTVKPTWRDAYKTRKPVTVQKGVPFYPEHMEYLNRHIFYTCLTGIKPMLPAEFNNQQALQYCACMTDKYYTDSELERILIKLDYNPDKVLSVFKEVQNEYWAVMDDQFKSNYREIVKYPPGYYEKITADRAICIDDINYKSYTKQDSVEE